MLADEWKWRKEKKHDMKTFAAVEEANPKANDEILTRTKSHVQHFFFLFDSRQVGLETTAPDCCWSKGKKKKKGDMK